MLEKHFTNELTKKERLSITGEYSRKRMRMLYWFLILPQVMNGLKLMGSGEVKVRMKVVSCFF